MILIVGLGNPGKKYQLTRHNIGFQVVDEFVKKNNFPDFKISKKFNALISEGIVDGAKVILAKPQTFMNNSGKAVKSLIRNWKLEIRNLVVVHDDIDLPLGKIKISIGRGSAGHKGVQSIIDELATKNFVRFRIGINRFAQNFTPYRNEISGAGQKSKINPSPSLRVDGEQSRTIKNQKLDEFVLKKFTKDEETIAKEVIEKTCQAIEFFLESGLEKSMSKYNV